MSNAAISDAQEQNFNTFFHYTVQKVDDQGLWNQKRKNIAYQ